MTNTLQTPPPSGFLFIWLFPHVSFWYYFLSCWNPFQKALCQYLYLQVFSLNNFSGSGIALRSLVNLELMFNKMRFRSNFILLLENINFFQHNLLKDYIFPVFLASLLRIRRLYLYGFNSAIFCPIPLIWCLFLWQCHTVFFFYYNQE